MSKFKKAAKKMAAKGGEAKKRAAAILSSMVDGASEEAKEVKNKFKKNKK